MSAGALSLIFEVLAWLILPLAMARLAFSECRGAFRLRSHWPKIRRNRRTWLRPVGIAVALLLVLGIGPDPLFVPLVSVLRMPFDPTVAARKFLGSVLTVWSLAVLGAASGFAGLLLTEPPGVPDSTRSPPERRTLSGR